MPLWSARAVIAAPEAVRAVHEAYLAAGAGAITTATFRTTRRSLAREGLGDRAEVLTRRAVELALDARRRAGGGALVLGSVAPLEECYDPGAAPPSAVCAAEHAEQMRTLIAAGVDRVLIETMGTVRESAAAARCAAALAPGRWMISFCMRNDEPGVLLSGEPVRDVLAACDGAAAVGVNCVAAPATEAHVRALRAAVPASVPVMAYANVGTAADDGSWICTDAVDPDCYAAYAERWLAAGATIIGGCCGTRPAHVARLARGAAS